MSIPTSTPRAKAMATCGPVWETLNRRVKAKPPAKGRGRKPATAAAPRERTGSTVTAEDGLELAARATR